MILHNDDALPDIPLTVSQWADEHRVLTRFTSAEPGGWRTDRTPYLREIMDSFGDPTVEEVTFRKCTQVGGTEVIVNCIGYAIDHDPSPTIVVLPRDEDAKGWAFKRVKPMVEASPALRAHTTGKEDDLAGKLYKFNSMLLKFAGANSPADLASDPCRYVLLDEVDKYPKFSGREADPVKLAIERARTFWNRKIFKASTPTTTSGYIEREYQKTDKRLYWVPCPRCGAYQPLAFRRQAGAACGEMKWPEGTSADEIRTGRLAWYACGHCAGRIEESERDDMVACGVWCPTGCTVDADGRIVGERTPTGHRGYAISALYSPWVTWSQIVAEFLDAKGAAASLMAFVNSVLGEPWEERTKATSVESIRQRIGHESGIAPHGAVVLTAGVDVQLDHFWFVVRAWGIGEESWLVRYGRVETFEELLFALIDTQYPKANGAGLLDVRLACIDSGYRTNEVYHVCRRYAERVRPIKGYDHRLASPYRMSLIERDAQGRALPGGIGLWTLDTDYYKTKLNRLIHTPPGSPGEWHLCDVEQDYLDQITSEQRVVERDRKTGKVDERWKTLSEGRANHLLDCEVYALAAAEMLKVYLLRAPGDGPTVYTPPPPSASWMQRGAVREPARGGGWLRR